MSSYTRVHIKRIKSSLCVEAGVGGERIVTVNEHENRNLNPLDEEEEANEWESVREEKVCNPRTTQVWEKQKWYDAYFHGHTNIHTAGKSCLSKHIL